MSVLTETDVCNMALDHLRQKPISSMDDDSYVARWFKRNYDTIRDGCIRAHPWNFAIEIREIPKDVTNPPFGWAYRYAKPSGMIRMLSLRYDGVWGGRDIPYELVRGYIHCNLESPLRVRYITRVEDPQEWTPHFVEYVAAALATRLAHPLTGKKSMVDTMRDITAQAYREAIRTDGMEGHIEDPDQDDVITVRGSAFRRRIG